MIGGVGFVDRFLDDVDLELGCSGGVCGPTEKPKLQEARGGALTVRMDSGLCRLTDLRMDF